MSSQTVGLFAAFGAAALSFLTEARDRAPWVRTVSRSVFGLAVGALVFVLGRVWVEAGRPPMATLYESILVFVLMASLTYVAFDRVRSPALGAVVCAALAATLLYAALRADLEALRLPPSLRSVWFVPHVSVYLLGYGALFFGTTCAVSVLLGRSFGSAELMHRAISAGFALVTLGLVIGAIWAEEAWGDWWAWDPKECWALVTWLVYSVYFHVRRQPRWGDRVGAWVAVLGFSAVLATYLGLGFLPSMEASVHVYAR
ncbi:MAG: cytochrome c biogenesis protein CcsA [Deltaproteobacteria bacterium]|nr:cytochrome c biogenesis protein CcsA [Deltaproteobacteria bacterium]